MKSKKIQLPGDRTFEQIRNHYEVEKAIANKLKKATKEERIIIYKTMYNELFKQVPDHPRLKRRENSKTVAFANLRKLRLVDKYINKSSVFVEFGPGDCRFAINISNHVRFVYGIDISDQRKQLYNLPKNFELIIYDGYDLKMQENSADVVFSDQLIEHFHPDDIKLHFQLVRRILKPQGVYIFYTPHRFSGPHDVSRYFSNVAEGFHLKEWTYTELTKILKILKYSSWHGYWYSKGILIKMPFVYFNIIEELLNFLPKRLRNIASKYLLPDIIIVAIK